MKDIRREVRNSSRESEEVRKESFRGAETKGILREEVRKKENLRVAVRKKIEEVRKW